MPDLKRWLASRSVFSILLISSVVLTTVLATVLILALRQIADEHPRRQLAKVLFQGLVSDKTPQEIALLRINQVPLVVIPVTQSQDSRYTSYQTLFELAQKDSEGIALQRNGSQLMAVFYRGHDYILVPAFGGTLSKKAMWLTALVVIVILLTLLLSHWVIRIMTRPFEDLTTGARQVEAGHLNYRIPLNKTYGEFMELAENFNRMTERMQRIHEVRRHMLLAIPHELRTPLTRLKVRKDLIQDEELRQAILRDINNLEGVLDAVLHAEKNSFSELEMVNLITLLEKLLPEYQSDTQDVFLHINAVHPQCKGTESSIKILLRNLLSNAVFYGEANPVDVYIESLGTNQVRIRVVDRGEGIDVQHIPFLTEPFWRVDPSRQRLSGGYGLGLYICKTIVTELGGKLEITSSLGHGVEVSVTLPGLIYSPRRA